VGADAGDAPLDFEAMVPSASPGIALYTHIVLPPAARERPVPVVLEREPYDPLFQPGAWDTVAQRFSALGYGFVMQACRGVYQSQGTYSPYSDDVADGAALMAWTATQPWADAAHVGTFGCSYSGYTALATAIGDPRVAAVVAGGPVASWGAFFQGGLPSMYALDWQHFRPTGQWITDAQVATTTNALAIADLDVAILGSPNPFWRAQIVDMTPTAKLFETAGIERRWAELRSPVLVYSSGELTAHAVEDGVFNESDPRVRDAHRLLVLPGEHCDPLWAFVNHTGVPEDGAVEQFLAGYLGGTGAAEAMPRVQYRVETTPGPLTAADAFPPPAEELVFYLNNTSASGGTLETHAPAAGTPLAQLPSDPANDDPCQGTSLLTYAAAPLEEALVVVGQPKLTLSIASTAVDADVFFYVGTDEATLFDGGLRARYRNGFEKPMLLEPGASTVLEMQSFARTAATLPAKKQLLLQIAPSRCGWSKNPNTGEPVAAQTAQRPAVVSVASSAAQPSELRLQVVRHR
jgi:predicted acyl esterase